MPLASVSRTATVREPRLRVCTAPPLTTTEIVAAPVRGNVTDTTWLLTRRALVPALGVNDRWLECHWQP